MEAKVCYLSVSQGQCLVQNIKTITFLEQVSADFFVRVCPSFLVYLQPFHVVVKLHQQLTWFRCNTVLIRYCLNMPTRIKAVMKTRAHSAMYRSARLLLVKMFLWFISVSWFQSESFTDCVFPVFLMSCHLLQINKSCEWEYMLLWNRIQKVHKQNQNV